jgi:hypothetical protein
MRNWGKNRTIDTGECLKKVQKGIVKGEMTFKTVKSCMSDYEYLEMEIEYEICGVVLDRDLGGLKLFININSLEPTYCPLEPRTVYDAIEESISANLPFLIKDTYFLTIDPYCLRKLEKGRREAETLGEMKKVLRRNFWLPDESARLMLKLLEETLPSTSFESLEDLVSKPDKNLKKPEGRGLVEILPDGIPCPLCRGILSHETVSELHFQSYMKKGSFDDDLF